MPEHIAGVSAGTVDFACGAEGDGHTGDDAGRRPLRSIGGCSDARDDVIPDCPFIGHPEDGAGGVLTGSAQHRRPECREQDRHGDGVGDIHRAVHGKAVVLHINRTRPGERPGSELRGNREPMRGPVVGQPELVGDDPVMRWADAERESASASSLRGQRLLCHRDGMPGLDGHDGGSEFDAVGRLAEQRDRRHGVEIAGDLRDPEGCEAVVLGGLHVGNQAGQSVGARDAPCPNRPSARCAWDPPLTEHSGPTRTG